MKSAMFQNWSIFSALYDVMREKALKQLNFAKCPSCGLFTPYRLKNVEGNAVKCKKCGSMIQLKRQIL